MVLSEETYAKILEIKLKLISEVLAFYAESINYHNNLQDNEVSKISLDAGEKAKNLIEELSFIDVLIEKAKKEEINFILSKFSEIKIGFGNPVEGTAKLHGLIMDLKSQYK